MTAATRFARTTIVADQETSIVAPRRAPLTPRLNRIYRLSLVAVFVLSMVGGAAGSAGGLSTIPAAHAAGVLTVTATYDPGSCPSSPGSQSPLTLRCAIAQANADGSGDTIAFDIPPYDCTGYQSGQTQTQPGQICTFAETLPAYTLTANNTTIDGYSLPGTSPSSDTSLSQGDNADIAVELTSCNYTYNNAPCPVPTGLTISGSGDVVEGLAIDGTNVSFTSSSSNDVLEGSFVGVTPDGKPDNDSPNSTTGAVDISGGSSDTIGEDTSVACGETGSPGSLCGADVIGGNAVGVTVESDPTSHVATTGTTIADNVVGLAPNGSGNLGNNYGLLVSGANSSISGNLITDNSNGPYEPLQLCAAFNGGSSGGGDGIFISGTGSVTGNTVTSNQDSGIMVGCLGDTSTHVSLSQNLVHDNGNLAIDLAPKGQVDCSSAPPGPDDYTPCPVISSATSSAISGTACDNCAVEVFIASNGPDEAQHGGSTAYLGLATANGSGSWTLSGPFATGFDPSTQQVTATATTPSSPGPAESSEFALDFPSPEASSSGAAIGPGHTFTVTTTADNAPFTSCPNGPGGTGYTLRCAITDVVSQENNWGDTIAFDIPSTDSGCDAITHVCKISLSNPLPTLTSLSAIVDGYTQPDAQPNTEELQQGDNAAIKIQIDGTSVGSIASGLTLGGDHDFVRGLSVTGFWNGVNVLSSGGGFDALQGDFVGEGPDGSAQGNQNDGVLLPTSTTPAPSTAVMMGGSSPDARDVLGADSYLLVGGGPNTIVQGNYIGTDPTGAIARGYGSPNYPDFAGVEGSPGLVGGPNSGDGNLISGNDVGVEGAPGVIQGNEIGTTASGQAALDNSSDGIDIQSSTGAVIGGAGQAGNLISGNVGRGIWVTGSSNVDIQGDRIGTNADGSAAIPNGGDGIDVSSSTGSVIGGAGGAGNVVSGNGGGGISLFRSSSIAIEGNHIGTDGAGSSPIPNGGDGIDVGGSSGNASIGAATGQASAAPNVIADNAGDGVSVGQSSGDGIYATISQNSIFDNGSTANPGLGIDLYPKGPSCTAASPPQYSSVAVLCPVISSATASSVGGTASFGSGGSTIACSGCTVEVFQATQEADDDFSGTYYGEGETFLGSTTTDSSGNWTCSTSNTCVAGTKPFSGLPLTATATTTTGKTSEFAADVTASTTGTAPKVRRHYVQRPLFYPRHPRLTVHGSRYEVGRPTFHVRGSAYHVRLSTSSPRASRLPGSRAHDSGFPLHDSRVGAQGRSTLFSPVRETRGPAPALKPGLPARLRRPVRALSSGAAPAGLPRPGSSGVTSFARRAEAGGAAYAGGGASGANGRLSGARGRTANVVRRNAYGEPRTASSRQPPTVHHASQPRFRAGRQPSVRPRAFWSSLERSTFRNARHANALPAGVTRRLRRLKPIRRDTDPVLTVTTRQDVACLDPAGMSLRCAILTANADTSGNAITIHFDIPSGCDSTGFCQLSPIAPLPAVTRADVTIDGYSQTGAGADTNTTFSQGDNAKILIGLDGRAYGPGASGLTASAAGFTLSGVWVRSWTGAAVPEVYLQSSATGATLSGDVFGGASPPGALAIPDIGARIDAGSATVGGTSLADINLISGAQVGVELCGVSGSAVQGNYVGTDASGASALSFLLAGVPVSGNDTGIEFDDAGSRGFCSGVSSASSADTIGAAGAGNVVSGNAGTGIELGTSTGDTVQGNLIGVDATGANALGNGGAGIDVGGTGNTIGGTGSGQGNVVSDNGLTSTDGIHLTAGPNTIQGNYIGTDISGTKAIGNVGSGIGIPYSASANGEVIGPGNVISANGFDGIFTGCATDFTIQGNKIGTNAAGTVGLGSQYGQYGIYDGCIRQNVTGSMIGGPGAGQGNLISWNNWGITSYAYGLTIQGNLIGTDITGAKALGNGTGISMHDCSGGLCYIGAIENETIGGTSPGDGNAISGNGYGVQFQSCEQSCVIEGNEIGASPDGTTAVGNTGFGLDLFTGCPCSGTHDYLNLTVGGTTAGAANLIAHNGGTAIFVNPDQYNYNPSGSFNQLSPSHVAVQMNQIYDNGGEIELATQGPLYTSGNCTSGGNAVVNDGIACPRITGETIASGDVSEIDGQAPTGSTVDVWTASNGSGDGGSGGAMVYLGAVTASGSTCGGSSCPSGTSSWSLTASGGLFPSCGSGPGCVSGGFAVVPDQPVTATATFPVSGASPAQNETSEFAQDFAILSSKDTIVVTNGDTTPGVPCDDASYGTASFGQFNSQISLRCAISEANLLPNQTVTFNITSGSTEISPTAALPPITAAGLTINGYSQNGASPNTNPIGQPDNAVIKVQLDGSGLTGYSSGLYVDGQNEVIEGLSITNFSGAGIEADNGNGLAITGDFLGLTPSGTAAGSTEDDGVDTYANYNSSNPGTTIGGIAAADRNVISGNAYEGIYLEDYNDTVQGNYIGTDLSGDTALPNERNGVEVEDGQGSTIGGTSLPASNVISGNSEDGVRLRFDDANTVEGNFIGTDGTGANPVPNGLFGIEMQGSQTDTVGGTTPSAANTVSGNDSDGIHIWEGASGNTVEGNFIGTDATGTKAIPNGTSLPPATLFSYPNDGSGVFLDNVTFGGGTTGNTIGPGNVIGANAANAVELDGGSGTDANNVVGNLIGVGVNGAHLGNGANGIYLHDGAGADDIGGTGTGQGNTIEWNGLSGVKVGSSATDGSEADIEGNTIVDNVQTGAVGTDNEITLTGENPNNCTAANVAGAPNDSIPCPSNVSLVGTTASAMTCAGCTVDFYTFKVGLNEATQEHGGGLTWLGSVTAAGSCAIGTSGSCSDNTPVTFTVPAGTLGVTATATDPTVTSEFSANSGVPTAERVAWLHVSRAGRTLTFHWRMAIQSGVAGFNLYAGSHQLNSRLITPHTGWDYSCKTQSTGHSGRFSLRVLLTNGRFLEVRDGR